ncbi:MAG: 2OG-Fe(II) oxygenase [Geodermatophilaceae bacterium]
MLPIARDWWTKLRRDTPWPDDFDEWLARCHAAGQSRTTPILLKYGQGDWNAPPRDLYGDLVFTTRDRPVESVRGWSAGQVREGVSLIRSGTRMALALLFHDAG